MSTRPSTQPVSIGVCDKEDIDDGTIVAMSFINLKGRTDLYPMFSTATVIGSTPVHRALVLLSRDDEELVAIGIVREDKRDDRRVFLVALQTTLACRIRCAGLARSGCQARWRGLCDRHHNRAGRAPYRTDHCVGRTSRRGRCSARQVCRAVASAAGRQRAASTPASTYSPTTPTATSAMEAGATSCPLSETAYSRRVVAVDCQSAEKLSSAIRTAASMPWALLMVS